MSALIKSIRGSDPDAALYWFARMLEGGEDARFIARRLVILASEDVGLADPLALVVADAAARAVEFVGLPEAQLNLAQAVVYLACAPKSNRVTAALGPGPGRRPGGAAGRRAHPPARRAATAGPASSGTARGTAIPTTTPGAGSNRTTVHPRWPGRAYYEPSEHGAEAALGERLRRRRRRRRRPPGRRRLNP